MTGYEPTGMGNEVLTVEDGCAVSYRARSSDFSSALGLLARLTGAADGQMADELEAERQETALITTEDGENIYRILVGDFRQDYADLASQGARAMIDFFNSQRDEFGGAWSTRNEDRAIHLRDGAE